MKCPRCQSQNREGVRFCEECGGRLVTSCASCGAELLPDKKFCGSCGSPATPEPVERSALDPGLHPQAPRREDPHLAPRPRGRAQAGHGAVRRPQGLDGAARRPRSRGGAHAPRPGARADDGGGPPLRGHGEPGDGRRHHGALRRAARPRGPRRARLLRRAAHAGDACGGTPRRCGAAQGVDVQIRVGLNSGEVVVRAIGSDLHMDYTAVGQTTHLAARMEQLAAPGIDPADRARRCGWPRATSRSSRSGPVPGQGAGRAGRGLRAGRAPAPRARGSRRRRRAGSRRFVGPRRRAGAAAPARWSGPARGHGQVVALVGRARGGQVAARLGVHPLAPHAGLARAGEPARSPTARPPPYLPVIDLLKTLLPDRGPRRRRGASARRSPASC